MIRRPRRGCCFAIYGICVLAVEWVQKRAPGHWQHKKMEGNSPSQRPTTNDNGPEEEQRTGIRSPTTTAPPTLRNAGSSEGDQQQQHAEPSRRRLTRELPRFKDQVLFDYNAPPLTAAIAVAVDQSNSRERTGAGDHTSPSDRNPDYEHYEDTLIRVNGRRVPIDPPTIRRPSADEANDRPTHGGRVDRFALPPTPAGPTADRSVPNSNVRPRQVRFGPVDNHTTPAAHEPSTHRNHVDSFILAHPTAARSTLPEPPRQVSFGHAASMPVFGTEGYDEAARRDYHSTIILPNGQHEHVGTLELPNVPDPSYAWPMYNKPYYFISHNGKDAKEHIARPTHWFISNILKVDVFMDGECMTGGDDKMRVLTENAYRCTHAVVILTPSFRKSKYCVKELNTFMERHKRSDGIKLVPALWGVDCVEDYCEALNDIVYLGGGSADAARYMIGTLWPHIMQALNHRLRHTLRRQDLGRLLVRYVIVNRGQHPIPKCLEDFVRDQQSGVHCSCVVS